MDGKRLLKTLLTLKPEGHRNAERPKEDGKKNAA
jgi:hypothetical protein